MALHLFHKPACPFCWKLLIALHEAGLPFTDELMDPPDRARLAPLSPQGSVPVLVVDAALGLWESAVAAEYVAELSGALMPDRPEQRARVRLLHGWSDRIVGPGLREVIFEKRANPPHAWDLERIARGTAAWRECLDWLEPQVDGPGGVVGDAFTLADCALVPRFALAEEFGVGVGPGHPRLAAWYATQRRRPSVAETRPERFGWVNPVPFDAR